MNNTGVTFYHDSVDKTERRHVHARGHTFGYVASLNNRSYTFAHSFRPIEVHPSNKRRVHLQNNLRIDLVGRSF